MKVKVYNLKTGAVEEIDSVDARERCQFPEWSMTAAEAQKEAQKEKTRAKK